MSDENKEKEENQSAPAEVETKEENIPVPSDEGVEVETPEKFKSLVDGIEKMSVIELNELVKFLEKKFGVSAAAVAVASSAAGDSAGGEEKSAFNVELKEAGGQKIAIIKIVKEVLGLGLKEAKDMVDGAPVVLKEGLKKEEAEELKKRLEEAGGKVELK